MIFERARRELNLGDFKDFSGPIDCGKADVRIPFDNQYILRMLIKKPGERLYCVPSELNWIYGCLFRTALTQSINGFNPDKDFVYITVRHGVVSSVTDDEWHVDGFSMRKPHRPEQNYIWSSSNPTEILNQGFEFPDDFYPMKHNIHQFFQDNASGPITTLEPQRLYLIDPYIVHRRPKLEIGTLRTFFRISFVPIEIEDDTCTQNPRREPVVYGRQDIRNSLTRYGV